MGSLVSSLISAPLAAITGNYRIFYLVIAAFVVFSMIIIQRTYAKKQRTYR